MKKLTYIFLTIAFIFLIYYMVDFKAGILLIGKAKWYFLIPAILMGILNSFLVAFKLKNTFSLIKKLSLKYFWALSNIGSMISIILPFSAGGFSMAYFLSKKAKVAYSKALFLIVADMLLGISPILITAPLAVYCFYPNFFYVLFLYIFLILIIFLIYKKPIFVKSLLLGFVVFVISNFQFYLFILAFGLTPSFMSFVMANTFLGVLSLIPGAPAKLGQYEAFGILTLPFLLKIDSTTVFSTMVLMRITSVIIILSFGFLSLYLLKSNLNDFKKNEKT